ncbi:hypothetical protein M0811_04235 [Anaeramoeba ignava]|uniref:Mic1 domain-containing protein n=1 Tax=Anaeramoeba ignava TaxID=1746090 RepID=A0A9Q0RHX6_ANAIG|nr:hypothetical protein M0811_04235 [Anaeramoeba ignava]
MPKNPSFFGFEALQTLANVELSFKKINKVNEPLKTEKNTEGHIVVNQNDLFENVFLPLQKKGLVSDQFLTAVLIEYIRSLNFFHINVEQNIYDLIIQTLLGSNRFSQLYQFIQYHVFEDSEQMGYKLGNVFQTYPPILYLALDMLHRLDNAQGILYILISNGFIMESLRFIQNIQFKDKIEVSMIRSILMKAFELKDMLQFYHAFKFFEDRIRENKMSDLISIFENEFQTRK